MELKAFNHNIGLNQLPSPRSSAKTIFTSALWLYPTSKETPMLLWLLYAERMTKSFSSIRQSVVQVKCVSWTEATCTLRFESSLSRCAHLLGSLSPLAFKVARFRAIKPTYLTHCRLWTWNHWEWGSQQCVTESQFSGYSGISGQSSDIKGKPRL